MRLCAKLKQLLYFKLLKTVTSFASCLTVGTNVFSKIDASATNDERKVVVHTSVDELLKLNLDDYPAEPLVGIFRKSKFQSY